MDEKETLLAQQRKELSELRNLIKLPGWDRLVEIGDGQRKARWNQVMIKPCKSVDATLEQEFMKGEYAGIALFFQLPLDRIGDLEELIKQIEEPTNGE